MIPRLIKNTLSSFGFRVFSVLLSLLLVPVVVRAVGADGFGLILLAQSITGYFQLLSAGVPAGTVKFVAEYDARSDQVMVARVIAASFLFFLCAGALTMVLVGAFVYAGGLAVFDLPVEQTLEANRLMYVAAVVSMIAWPLGTFGHALEGLQQYPSNKLALGAGDLIGKAGAIFVADAGAPLELIFVTMNSGMVLSAALQFTALRRAIPWWRMRSADLRWSTFRTIFRYSGFMLLSKLSALLLYKTDRLILALFLPISSLTIYHVVTMPFTMVREMSSLYNAAITPAVSAVDARSGRAGLDSFIYTMGRYSNAFVAPLAMIGALLTGPFIVLWMGSEYTPYVWIAQLACAFQCIWQSNSALGRVFYGTGKVGTLTLIGVLMAILNVPLGVALVGTYGVAGVVLSTVAVGVVGIPLQYVFVMPALTIDRRRYLVDSVVRGQVVSWVIMTLLLPGRSWLGHIDSWAMLALAAVMLALLFYGAGWRVVVEDRHRQSTYRLIGRSAWLVGWRH